MVGKVVYAISVDGVPRYYGIGSICRAKSQLQTYRPVILTFKADADVRLKILKRDLINEQAIKLEKQLIASAPVGQLWNKNNGGAGASTDGARKANRRPSKRKKVSEKIKTLWAIPAWREKIIASRKGKMARAISTKHKAAIRSGLIKFHSSMTDAERKLRAHKASIARTPEDIARATKAMRDALTPESLSRRAKTRWENLTDEQRTTIIAKANAVRLAKLKENSYG